MVVFVRRGLASARFVQETSRGSRTHGWLDPFGSQAALGSATARPSRSRATTMGSMALGPMHWSCRGNTDSNSATFSSVRARY